jgi:integrase
VAFWLESDKMKHLDLDLPSVREKQAFLRELLPFEPYVLRHTALTQLAQAGCDAFTLARIAGHSSITITQRYIHPQADAIERAFAPFSLPLRKKVENGN